MIGKSFSHYEIKAKIGQGGMGEVYRAQDTKLGRDVAVKVLSESLAGDRDLLARFDREARVLAALNHPNIAAIHDLVEVEGRGFLVMEVVEGADLSARIDSAPLTLAEAVRIAFAIAEALEAAHEKGIIHRDLKPGNIKEDAAGNVKILDFGLAKALAGDDGGSDEDSATKLRNTPAVSSAVTAAGLVMGTAGYMSPEQARGHTVDRRADIWSFGCVLYEMLTGKRAFPGDTVTDVLASVVSREPAFDALPADTPDSIRALLERCLRKDASRRLQSIGDARVTLQDYLDNPDEATAIAAASSARFPNWLIATIGAAVGAAAFAAFAMTTRAGSGEEPLRRLDVHMGERAFDRSLGSGVALSPTGDYLAFVTGTAGGESRLHLRALDRSQSEVLDEGTGAPDSPYHPFFSADGKWLGYVTASEMKKISVTGGASITIAEVTRSRGASWNEAGRIVYAPSPSSPLFTISDAGGGVPEPLTVLDAERSESTHRWPQWIRGGEAVLFTASPSSTNLTEATLDVITVESGERKQIHRGGYYGRYVESGHILYVNENTLFALPFDVDRLEVTGAPVPVVEHVAGASAEGTGHFDVSNNGLLAYLSGEGPAEDSRLVWVSRAGQTEELWPEPGIYGNPKLSPDGSRLSVSALRHNNWDVWIYDLERSVSARITLNEGYDADQVWSPDGRWLAYASDRGGHIAIYRKRADGSGEPELVRAHPDTDWFPVSWSPDGKSLLATSATEIWVVPFDSEESPELFMESEFALGFPSFSPDGRFIAYTSGESGRLEIYVRGFANGGKWQVSEGGGSQQAWSADGRHLYYRTEEGVSQVSIGERNGELVVGRGENLFTGRFHGGLQGVVAAGFVFPDFEAAGDGSRFVMLEAEREAATSGEFVSFVTGWFQELRALAPPGS